MIASFFCSAFLSYIFFWGILVLCCSIPRNTSIVCIAVPCYTHGTYKLMHMGFVDHACKSSCVWMWIMCGVLKSLSCDYRNHLSEELTREPISKPEGSEPLSMKEKYIHAKVTCFHINLFENKKRLLYCKHHSNR
jgi:hypothetical protein